MKERMQKTLIRQGQAINQTLTPIYERQFSPRSYGFRPRRGCHDALRGAQKIVDASYRSNGWGYAKRKQKLEEYIKGWVGYYHLANMNYMWGNSRLGYWRIAGSYILSRAITNEKLSMAGYATLMGSYIEWHPK